MFEFIWMMYVVWIWCICNYIFEVFDKHGCREKKRRMNFLQSHHKRCSHTISNIMDKIFLYIHSTHVYGLYQPDWRDMLHIICYSICYVYLSTITPNYCLIFITYIIHRYTLYKKNKNSNKLFYYQNNWCNFQSTISTHHVNK